MVFCGACLTLLGGVTMRLSSFGMQSQPAMAGMWLGFAIDDRGTCITRELCLPRRLQALCSHYEIECRSANLTRGELWAQLSVARDPNDAGAEIHRWAPVIGALRSVSTTDAMES
jgi:hypothetical protein